MSGPRRTWSFPRPSPARMSPRWIHRDEPPPDDTFLEYMRRNTRWIRDKRAYSAMHARLFSRFLALRSRQPWIRSDGPVFMGAGCDISAQRGLGHLQFGRFVWIGNGCAIRCHEGHLRIGDKTVFGSNNVINCYLDIEIGRECIFADWIYVTDFDHAFGDPQLPIRSQGIHTSPVRIGNGVWLGEKTSVLRGVSVGDGAIIASHACVTRDVPPGAIVAGVPARVLKMRPGWEDGPPRQIEGHAGWGVVQTGESRSMPDAGWDGRAAEDVRADDEEDLARHAGRDPGHDPGAHQDEASPVSSAEGSSSGF